MTRRDATAVAALVVLSVVCGAAAAGVGAAQSAPEGYVIEQAGDCREIEPLETGGTVEAFYDYRNHETHPDAADNLYSSYGTRDLQADDTSLLAVHEGTDGTSLVVVHDRLEGETNGGAAAFDVVGVPPEAAWVVRDDDYEGETNMAEFYDGNGWLGASWIWAGGRTDGGAIRGGLDDGFALTIHPAFNEDAPLYDDEEVYDPDWHGDGRIEDWVMLSGDPTDPERIRLDRAEPVTIRTGTCDKPPVTYERTANGIAATVANPAGEDGDALETLGGSSADVRFAAVELRGVDPRAGHPVDDRAAAAPELSEDVAALSHLALESGGATAGAADGGTGDGGDGTTASGDAPTATVTVDVAADWLAGTGLAVDDVAVYGTDGDGWRDLEADAREEGDRYRLEATADGLEHVAVVVPEESVSDDATERDPSAASSDGDENPDSTREGPEGGATDEPRAHEGAVLPTDANRPVLWAGAAVATVAAVILGGAWAASRRRRS